MLTSPPAGPARPSLRIASRAASIVLVVLLVRLAVAAIAPVVMDEAYYIEWSRALDGGYFDHPPLIAWVNVTSRLAPSSALAGRLGAMVAAALGIPFVFGLLRRAGMGQPGTLAAGLVLVHMNAFVLMGGTLSTPDALLVPAWCAALHEAAAALQGSRRRWLTAGLATGVGLLGKYTMALIGPVFLWAMLRSDRRALATPWPYLGGVVALLVFAPHLAWNARNEWVPIRMQVQHGAKGGHDPGFAIHSDLPAPLPQEPDGPELRLGLRLGAEPPSSEEPPPPSGLAEFAAALGRLGEYLVSLLAVWGALLVPLARRVLLRLRGRPPRELPIEGGIRPLLEASVWVPIVAFGLASLSAGVEWNWAAIYLVGAGVLLAAYGATRLWAILLYGGMNAVFCLLLAVYVAHPELVSARRTRLIGETVGWPDLAAYCQRLEGPLLSSREQLVSMLRFYAPDLEVAQYPGILQPSEFVRRAEWNLFSLHDLHRAGGFWLLHPDDPLPPRIEGFEPVAATELRWCIPHGLVATDSADFAARGPPCDDDPVHLWYLFRYR